MSRNRSRVIHASLVHHDLVALAGAGARRLRRLPGASVRRAAESVRAALAGATRPLEERLGAASVDRAAGMLSVRAFERRLAWRMRIERFRPASRRLVVVAFDIERFEAVAESHGRAASEAIRAEVSRRLRLSAGRDALLARTGDARFALAARFDASADLRRAVGEIRLASASAPITVSGTLHAVGLAAGIACPGPGEPAASLVTRAGEAAERGGCGPANEASLVPEPTLSRGCLARRASC